MAQILIRPGMVETVHKICGSLDVARDMVERSAVLYLSATDAPTAEVLEPIAHAAAMLSEAVRALERDISAPGVGRADSHLQQAG